MRWGQQRRSGVWAALLYLLPAIVWVMTIGGGRAIADGPRGLEFVDASPATISPGWKGTISTDVAIRNNGESTFEPTLQLRGGDRCKPATTEFTTNEDNGKKGIGKGEMKIFKLKIFNVSLPATCYLDLQTRDATGIIAGSVKQLKLSQRFVTCWVWLWLILTIAVSLGATIHIEGRVYDEYGKPEKIAARDVKLGSPAWDFSKSWTSTLTLAGAIVAAALAVSALPELTHYASKGGYGTLVLLFSALALLAPLPYLFAMHGEVKEETKSQNREQNDDESNDERRQRNRAATRDKKENRKFVVVYEGNGRALLMTCLVTLVAGLGQIAVLGLLIDEIFRAMFSWFWLLSSFFVGLIWIPLLLYSVRSMWLTFWLQRTIEKPPAQLTDSASSAEPLRPSWPLL